MKYHWKNIIVAFSVIFIAVAAGSPAAAESWAQVADKIEQEKNQSVKEAAVTEKMVEKDRATLLKELKDFKTQERREDRALNRLKKEFDSMLEQEAKLVAELESEQEEIEAVEGTVRAAAKEASSLSRDNPITPEFPDRNETIRKLLESRRFPGLDVIKSLNEIFFQELGASGTIVRRTGNFVGPNGRNVTGDIIRIGRFTTLYRMADGSIGFLIPEASGERLIAIAGDVPRKLQSSIKAYFNKESVVVPIDPSGGAAFIQLTSKEDLRDKFEKGGPLMWPILLVGIVAIILSVYRVIYLGIKKGKSDKIFEKIREMAQGGLWKEAKEFCSSKAGRIPTCQMLASVMDHIGETQEVLENALEEQLLRIGPRLARFLPTLAVLGTIAPLLGLLGTVTGMINTFHVITMVGTGDPRMMSGGISEALLTTQFGLIVAIPIMLMHHYLERRVDKIEGDMLEKGQSFMVTILKQGNPAEA